MYDLAAGELAVILITLWSLQKLGGGEKLLQAGVSRSNLGEHYQIL
jgi:hypothetical protein